MTTRNLRQRSEHFDEPDREKMVKYARMHVDALLRGVSEVWFSSGMEHLVIHTIGRRTGRLHEVALPFWLDANGDRLVVASNLGSARHPDWFLNLEAAETGSSMRVSTRQGEYMSVPEILDGPARDELWKRIVEDRPFYADYQVRCARIIPVVRLAGAEVSNYG